MRTPANRTPRIHGFQRIGALALLWVGLCAVLNAQQPTDASPSSNSAQKGAVYKVGDGVSAPTVRSKVEPAYSEEALKAKLQGTVIVRTVVDEKGLPQQMQVTRSLGLGLDQKGIEAVSKWRFRPGMKDGKPVPVVATIQVNFRLMEGGVPKDYPKALRAELEAIAQYNLGVMYASGDGVARDYAEAVRWYRKAAEQGLAQAQYSLAAMYSKGEGVPQDYSESLHWCRRAADQGYSNAQFALGVLYEHGREVIQDWVQAYMWLNLAASRANGDDRKRFSAERDSVAGRMTSAQIAEAQRLAREWKPKTAH